ncbi:MAG: uracil-DNA glycosylase [Candidatus Protistobacter heckmanni]|nr:uracil-DNA glycosylase [Candidatus Protistobacter heckmanni]
MSSLTGDLFDAPAPGAPSLDAQLASLPAQWLALLGDFPRGAAWKKLASFVDGERASGKTVYPDDVFHALRMSRPGDVRVVILGQDPYHGIDKRTGIPQAHGMAFSVPNGAAPPPSLKNIYKEIARDPGPADMAATQTGNLEPWARQGVLLLNTVLTVLAGEAESHAGRGWEAFTDTLLAALASQHLETGRKLDVLLWGSHAKKKAELFAGHLVLTAVHPSPLSAHRGFLGCGHFARTNDFLREHGLAPIDWSLPAH